MAGYCTKIKYSHRCFKSPFFLIMVVLGQTHLEKDGIYENTYLRIQNKKVVQAN